MTLVFGVIGVLQALTLTQIFDVFTFPSQLDALILILGLMFLSFFGQMAIIMGLKLEQVYECCIKHKIPTISLPKLTKKCATGINNQVLHPLSSPQFQAGPVSLIRSCDVIFCKSMRTAS